MTTLDEHLDAATAEVARAAAAIGPVDDALAAVRAAGARQRRRTRIATAAAAVAIVLVAATAVAVAARGTDPILDVSGPPGSTSTAPATVAPAPTTTTAVVETTVAPTSAVVTSSAPAPPTTTPRSEPAPAGASTTTTTPVPPTTSTPPTTRRPAPGPHPDPLPGTGTFDGSGEAVWDANVPPRYTFRLMYWAPGNPQPLGPLDLTVERSTNSAGSPVETVVAAYDPNAGVELDPTNLQHTIGNIWELLQEFVGCQCVSGTAAAGQPVKGVFSTLSVRWGTDRFYFEISGFWLE